MAAAPQPQPFSNDAPSHLTPLPVDQVPSTPIPVDPPKLSPQMRRFRNIGCVALFALGALFGLSKATAPKSATGPQGTANLPAAPYTPRGAVPGPQTAVPANNTPTPTISAQASPAVDQGNGTYYETTQITITAGNQPTGPISISFAQAGGSVAVHSLAPLSTNTASVSTYTPVPSATGYTIASLPAGGRVSLEAASVLSGSGTVSINAASNKGNPTYSFNPTTGAQVQQNSANGQSLG